MADEKKLVIKINYPNRTASLPDDDIPAADYVAEWNVKRIATASALLVFALVMLVWWGHSGDVEAPGKTAVEVAVPSPDTNSATARLVPSVAESGQQQNTNSQAPVAHENISVSAAVGGGAGAENTPAEPVVSAAGNGRVLRGVLAGGISDKEPVNLVQSPLILGRSGEKTLYYFTELEGLTGQSIYHEWLYQNKSVFKRPVKITDAHWRTATHKVIRDYALGDWTVRVVDQNGAVLHKIDFKVDAAK